MWAIRRETALRHLLELPPLISRYTAGRSAVPEVLAWMRALEESLARLRSPLAALVAAERGSVVAVRDGLRAPDQISSKGSRAQRAQCIAAVARIEAALRAEVERVDAQLAPLREKMVQMLAVAASQQPLAVPAPGERAPWLLQLWAELGARPEVAALHAYLAASLAASDRIYLLGGLVDNLGQ